LNLTSSLNLPQIWLSYDNSRYLRERVKADRVHGNITGRNGIKDGPQFFFAGAASTKLKGKRLIQIVPSSMQTQTQLIDLPSGSSSFDRPFHHDVSGLNCFID
jgi:hypothetical protein